MSEIFSAFRTTALMSLRTAKYVEAMIREGEQFDYQKWLKKVREEEAQANDHLATSVLCQAVTAQIGNRHVWPRSAPAIPVTGPIRRSCPDLKGTCSKGRLRRWLEKVQAAWHDFQANRARDAVYDYLHAVFTIVMYYKVRRRTQRLLRHAFKFADLQFDRNDPFTAIIRCTSGDAADNKMVSKWARALRYTARRKPAGMRLKAFMKDEGGVNACAAGYASRKRRRR